jgi:hypothetical protein
VEFYCSTCPDYTYLEFNNNNIVGITTYRKRWKYLAYEEGDYSMEL